MVYGVSGPADTSTTGTARFNFSYLTKKESREYLNRIINELDSVIDLSILGLACMVDFSGIQKFLFFYK